MTLADLISYTNIATNDVNKVKYQDPFVTMLLNEGQKDIVKATDCLQCITPYKTDTIADQQEYTLPAYVYKVDYRGGIAYYDGTTKTRLIMVTLKHLDDYESQWRTAVSGTPQMYYLRNTTIGLYPKPVTAVTNGIEIYYIRKPTDLTNGMDIPFEGDTGLANYHELISIYAIWKLKAMEASTQEGINQRDYYERQYATGVNRLKREYMDKIDMGLGFKPNMPIKQW